jgi:hypothetical protein
MDGCFNELDVQMLLPAKVNAGFIMFATDEQIRLMGDCSSLHMDGTFKTCPRPFAQVKFKFLTTKSSVVED